VPKENKRRAAARLNGRLGGLKTAITHSKEFLEERAAKAGTATRDRYGIDYYRYLRSIHPARKRSRTNLEHKKEILPGIIPEDATSMPSNLELLKNAAKNLTI
jgi:hypothetical protein